MIQPKRPHPFPIPRCHDKLAGTFLFDERTVICLTEETSEQDLLLARILTADLTDRHQIPVCTRLVGPAQDHPSVIIGRVSNAAIGKVLRARSIEVADLPEEGYILDVRPDGIVIAGRDDRGTMYGLQTLRQLIHAEQGRVWVEGCSIRDWPRLPFRGLRMFLPGKESIPFFRRFVRDFAAFHKYNTLILEVNAAMRLDRHPELNAGWHEFGRSLNHTRRGRPAGIYGSFQDSAHHDTGDFAIVEKDEVADMVAYARKHGLDVIPEVPSLTHAYYLLTRHRELAEIQQAEWPDTYCPCEPASYDLYFDVLDECIEVMEPSTVHIGHDEWRMPMDVCPRCQGRDYRELFVEDVQRIHGHLAERGIRTAMWGDHLIESVRGVEARPRESSAGHAYRIPGALTPDQVATGIPKDILILNWFWNLAKWSDAEESEAQLDAWGFEQVYGNFTPEISTQNYEGRSAREGVLGGAASIWTATRELNIGKDVLGTFVGCANLLWADDWPGPEELTAIIQSRVPDIRRRLRGAPTPVEDGEPMTPIGLDGQVMPLLSLASETVPLTAGWEIDVPPWRFRGTDPAGAVMVSVNGAGDAPAESAAIPIGEDASSLVFLHACAVPGQNIQGHFMIYDFPDTADLLGWYEVTYTDGYVTTIPVRYGVNILEWTWGTEPGALCYEADPLNCGPDATFFAYEWVNPRYGKPIQAVRLKGTTGFIDAHGKPITENRIALAALSLVKARPGPVPVTGQEDE